MWKDMEIKKETDKYIVLWQKHKVFRFYLKNLNTKEDLWKVYFPSFTCTVIMARVQHFILIYHVCMSCSILYRSLEREIVGLVFQASGEGDPEEEENQRVMRDGSLGKSCSRIYMHMFSNPSYKNNNNAYFIMLW